MHECVSNKTDGPERDNAMIAPGTDSTRKLKIKLRIKLNCPIIYFLIDEQY
jgi:hypothetical protein